MDQSKPILTTKKGEVIVSKEEAEILFPEFMEQQRLIEKAKRKANAAATIIFFMGNSSRDFFGWVNICFDLSFYEIKL